MRYLVRFVLGCVVLAWISPAAPAQSSFTYQGRLEDGGRPASGNYDFLFELFDVPTGGTRLVSLCWNNVTMVDGYVELVLPFLAPAFTGGDRWLQVGVRRDEPPTPLQTCPGTLPYTTLTPRQQITAAPYAIHATRPWVTNGANISFSGGNVGIGAAAPERPLQVGDDAVPDAEGMIRLESRSATGSWQRRWEVGVPETGEGVGDGRGYSLVFDDTQQGTTPEMTLRWGTGLLGLGTTNPQMSLQVETPSFYGSPAVGCMTGPENSRDWAYLHVSDPFDHSLIWNAGKVMRFGTETSPGVGYAEAMRITSDGRLLLGTTSWLGRLTVASTGNAVFATIPGPTGSAIGGAVLAGNSGGNAVYGQAESPALAGMFVGHVRVNGNLTKSSGSFRIDHPLDPANKYLQHSFVESPDMKNIYDGEVTTDERGSATVTLPEWFEALNRDFRYQLTVVDSADSDDWALAKVARPIEGNRFTIRTSRPGVRVCWQVTGVRRDAYAEANRIEVEVDKPPQERGRYLFPEGFGQAPERGLAIGILPPPPLGPTAPTLTPAGP